ncbi:MAG: hypothetical protein V1918_04340 [Planctomycetota bacterium]
MSRKWLILSWATLILGGLAVYAYAAGGSDQGKGSDRVLSKATFIHFKKAPGKPPWASGGGGGGGGKKEETGYYSYISNKARWKTVEPFCVNPACDENPDGSLDGTILGALTAGMEEWETGAGDTFDIFESLAVDPSAGYENGDLRGYNTISFGPYKDPNVIAITSVWGYFSGPPSRREIIEAHILFNDAHPWGDAALDGDGDGKPDSFLMDLQNIATHELGHSAGMGDVYQPGAGEETMYGYSAEGELKKRDLYLGDIAGLTALYR